MIAQGSQFGLGTYFLKYSREYEREADLLGAQIMARAGYDPRDMAEMFRTIEDSRVAAAVRSCSATTRIPATASGETMKRRCFVSSRSRGSNPGVQASMRG